MKLTVATLTEVEAACSAAMSDTNVTNADRSALGQLLVAATKVRARLMVVEAKNAVKKPA